MKKIKRQLDFLEQMRKNSGPDIQYVFLEIGMHAYRQKNYIVAEETFKRAAAFDNISAKNNYAYIIRRGEADDSSIYKSSYVLKLLRTGISRKDGFSTVKVALLLSINLK